MIRLVVSMDFQTDDLLDAYGRLRKQMEGLGAYGWETSDEWYRSDRDEVGDPDELQAAIDTWYIQERHE